mgnify:CR=1 FL=1
MYFDSQFTLLADNFYSCYFFYSSSFLFSSASSALSSFSGLLSLSILSILPPLLSFAISSIVYLVASLTIFVSSSYFLAFFKFSVFFLSASAVFSIFSEFSDFSDFSEFSFTRHMLSALHSKSIDRFETVVSELREAWLARMRRMLDQIGENVVLLWFSENEPTNEPWDELPHQMQVDPLFITKEMIDQLRPLVKGLIVAKPSKDALVRGTAGMIYPISQQRAAREMLGVDCHNEAAAVLVPAIRDQLYEI